MKATEIKSLDDAGILHLYFPLEGGQDQVLVDTIMRMTVSMAMIKHTATKVNDYIVYMTFVANKPSTEEIDYYTDLINRAIYELDANRSDKTIHIVVLRLKNVSDSLFGTRELIYSAFGNTLGCMSVIMGNAYNRGSLKSCSGLYDCFGAHHMHVNFGRFFNKTLKGMVTDLQEEMVRHEEESTTKDKPNIFRKLLSGLSYPKEMFRGSK